MFKAHRLLYHSTLGVRLIKKRREREGGLRLSLSGASQIHSGLRVEGSMPRV